MTEENKDINVKNKFDKDTVEHDFNKFCDDWDIDNGLYPAIDDSSQYSDGDGYTNYQEYNSDTDPGDGASIPFEIIETLPHDNSGITDTWSVQNNYSFAVLIDSSNGINISLYFMLEIND